MSVTENSKIEAVLGWLEENAFWNSELLEVRNSRFGGAGVFWKLKEESDPENDNLLLRIPKSNVLSPKNSFLYSILMDYEPTESTIDFKHGMHSIVLTFIYELSLGQDSPWYTYLTSFDLESETGLPLCLWSEEEKQSMANTEPDLLNMLDYTELILFYLECVKFARHNEKYVQIPSILQLDEEDVETADVTKSYHSNLIRFGKCVQAVISRAFTVDKFYGLSLVPGADLFNHLSPIVEGEKISARENVHFVCDDDEGLCDECGEYGCPHMDSDTESEGNFEEELSDSENEGEIEGEDGEEDEEGEGSEEGEDAKILNDLMEDIELPESESGSDSEENSEIDSQGSVTESDIEEIVPMTKITMQDILEVEADSDADTEHDDEEVSTLSLSEDEGSDDEDNKSQAALADEELSKELSDSSKCCDVVLTNLPSKEQDYELFNTYGNELSNPYLLQRYGFVCENNPNVSCLLSVQMFAYLKQEKMNKRKKIQLDMKLDWYEEVGFEIVNDICQQSATADDHEGHHGASCEDEHCEDNHEDGCGDDDCTECGEDQMSEGPETWQLSPKIQADGTPTEQTIALVRLLLVPFKIFYHKLVRAPSERRLVKRTAKYLLEDDISEEERALITRWIHGRMDRYKKTKVKGDRGDMISVIIREEKKLLAKALKVLA